MAENPYEPPQSLPQQPLGRKNLVGLTVLSLLSVPASAIAGSITCTRLAQTELVGFPIFITAGVATCLAIVVAALALEQRARAPLSWAQFRAVLGNVAKAQVRAALLILVAGCLTSSIVTAFALRDNGENLWSVLFIYGSILNLAWSSAAYLAWRKWFREQAHGENPFQQTHNPSGPSQ